MEFDSLNATLHIAGLGEILWDIYPDKKCLGGAPANAARHAKKLGAKASIISAVGEDSLGDEILQILKDEKINTNLIQRIEDKPTGQIRVDVDEEGIPTFHCTIDQAFDFMQWEESLNHLNMDAIVIGTLAQRNSASRNVIQKIIRSAEAKVVFDVNFRQWDDLIQKVVFETLPSADILKINEEEKEHLKKALDKTGNHDTDFLKWMLNYFDLELIALTLGPGGCILLDNNQIVTQSGISVNVKDTTGCGDAFTAGLLIKYLEGRNLPEVASFANALGAWTATQTGAVPDYYLEDVQALMDRIK